MVDKNYLGHAGFLCSTQFYRVLLERFVLVTYKLKLINTNFSLKLSKVNENSCHKPLLPVFEEIFEGLARMS